MNFLFYIFLASTDTVQYYYLLFDRLIHCNKYLKRHNGSSLELAFWGEL